MAYSDMGAGGHKPTEENRIKIRSLKSFGHTLEQISDYLDLDEKTIRKYYPDELRTAEIDAIAKVANRLFAKAVDQDNLAAQMFWLRTRGRWRETDTVDQINTKLLEEVRALREELDAKNRQDY